MTLRAISITIEAAGLRDARNAWAFANFNRFAFNSPNDMPEIPGIEPKGEVTSEADLVAVKAWMRSVSGVPANGS